MEVFKICREKYALTLNASGAPNRWNKKDEMVIYTAGSRSLAALESVVHRSAININSPYKILKIVISDDAPVKEIVIPQLPENWATLEAYTILQEMGSKWYQSKETLVLKISSAVIPQEHNFIINTSHPLFAENVILEKTESFIWDKRLL